MRASIRQVAEKAQVSPATASRVARGYRSLVNDDTYERVIAAMQALNYVPVRTALQNHHVATNTLGVVPMHRKPASSPIDSLTIEGLCFGAGDHGRDLLIMLRGEAEWLVNRDELRFLDRRTDGFIFISPGMGEWQFALEALVENDLPSVVCYRRDVPENVAWVDPDNQGIVRLALQCLSGYGHSRIAYVAGPRADSINNEYLADVIAVRNSYDDLERQRHFLAMTAEFGLDTSSELMIHVNDPHWAVTRKDFLALRDSGATAVVCVNDYIAQQIWAFAQAEGMSIPGDLSILGVGSEFQSVQLGLSSVVFGYDTVGRLAIEAWMELRQGKAAAACSKVAPVTLVERASTGPVRSTGKRH